MTGRDVYFAESASGVQYMIEQIPVHGVHSRSNARLAVVMGAHGQYELNFQDYTRVSAYPLLTVYPQSENIIWIMSDDRLLRYSSFRQLGEATKPFVSNVTTLHGEQQRLIDSDLPVTLEFEDNSIRFDFAFTAFDEHQRNQFQYKLEGFDHQWSDWRSIKQKEYTQISEGKYSFALRAKDIFGRVAAANPIRVVILPPWYRTWWAYILYFIGFIFVVLIGTRVRTRALVERAQELENIIEERTKTIREGSLVIEQQKEAIESLLAQKNDLFANISHEFRTPLTLILGPTQSLLKGNLTVQQSNQLQLVRHNTFRLLRMVNQILTLAKLSAIPHQARVNLSIKEHVDFMINSFMPLAREKKITLEVINLCDVKLYMVSDALEKILVNLISNALKYTPENGTVSIDVSEFKPDWVSIKVIDSGFGIPAEQLPLVFERFTRVNHPEHVKVQGTGLGLSMVKELVEAHGGKIYVETQLDVGSTFTVELPQAQGAEPAISASGLAQSSVDIELQAMELQQPSAKTAQPEPSDELMLRSGDKLTILVIEDTDQMREFVVSLFTDEFAVLSAPDGEQGVCLATKHLPDIIISDVMMPGKTGFEVCNELKTNELTSHIPIILLTAKSDMESRMQGWREQADEYLAKPFDEDELKLRVNNLLAIRKTLKQRFGRILHQEPEKIEQVSDELTGKDQDFLKRFSQVIEDNYASSEFNLPMAAAAMYASERLLQKKLKALMDHTFTEYLRTYRLTKAAQLLKTGKKVSDTADECGFSSQAYFSRCFKAEFGQTATQYQQEN